MSQTAPDNNPNFLSVGDNVKKVLSQNLIVAEALNLIDPDQVQDVEAQKPDQDSGEPNLQHDLKLLYSIVEVSVFCGCMIWFITELFTLWFACYTTIPTGYVGVQRRYGEILPETLNPGLHTIMPYVTTVHLVDTKIRTVRYEGEAFSYDLQHIHSTIDVQYSIAPSLADEMMATIGQRHVAENYFIGKSVAESLKAITCKYTSLELVTARPIVKQRVREMIVSYLQSSLDDYGMDQLFEIQNILLTNFEFSAGYNAAIEEKVRVEQYALEVALQKERRITLAEADRDRKMMKADAEAYVVREIGQANADALAAKNDALEDEPELLKLRMLEKWNGELPNFFIGKGNGTSSNSNQVVPVIHMNQP